jgi:hypothetical protein
MVYCTLDVCGFVVDFNKLVLCVSEYIRLNKLYLHTVKIPYYYYYYYYHYHL